MAKPIPLESPPRDPREELRSRLQSAPLEHADALLAGYELLQGLHDAGVLDLLRGLVGSGDKVLHAAVDATRAPDSIRALRNLLVVVKSLAEIEPDLFDGFLLAFAEAMREAKELGKEPPGFLGLLRKFRSKDLRRGIVMVNSLLEAWGRDFFSEAHSRTKNEGLGKANSQAHERT